MCDFTKHINLAFSGEEKYLQHLRSDQLSGGGGGGDGKTFHDAVDDGDSEI